MAAYGDADTSPPGFSGWWDTCGRRLGEPSPPVRPAPHCPDPWSQSGDRSHTLGPGLSLETTCPQPLAGRFQANVLDPIKVCPLPALLGTELPAPAKGVPCPTDQDSQWQRCRLLPCTPHPWGTASPPAVGIPCFWRSLGPLGTSLLSGRLLRGAGGILEAGIVRTGATAKHVRPPSELT